MLSGSDLFSPGTQVGLLIKLKYPFTEGIYQTAHSHYSHQLNMFGSNRYSNSSKFLK